MRKDITIVAEPRSSRGKNEARRTRVAGQIPAVVYGAFQDPVSLALNPRELNKIVRSSTGFNTIFTLAITGGETTPVMVVDQQLDPIRGTLLHADLKRIVLTKRIRVHGRLRWKSISAPITFTTARGSHTARLTARTALARGQYRLTLTPERGTARSIAFQIH